MKNLEGLESEAIYIIREAYYECINPVLLFSGGKDSIVLCHLAQKAFYPLNLPFPILHIDTGHNFKETLVFRDKFVQKNKLNLIVRFVKDSIDKGSATEQDSLLPSRNKIQAVTLLEALDEFGWDCALGGARRDEDKARAKERFFSIRNSKGSWDYQFQRPELWDLYNLKKNQGESFRVYPLSNWTEKDIWNYIQQETIQLPSLYFGHKRKLWKVGNKLLAVNDFVGVQLHYPIVQKYVRYRTLGDMTCTGAIESKAQTIEEIIAENEELGTSERESRLDDSFSEFSMEVRKKEGYF